jgi:hypothetical protein
LRNSGAQGRIRIQRAHPARAFDSSNRRAACLGEILVTNGTITALDASARSAEIELPVTNVGGEVTTPGSATVMLQG